MTGEVILKQKEDLEKFLLGCRLKRKGLEYVHSFEWGGSRKNREGKARQ
jgi:hypothetical protein